MQVVGRASYVVWVCRHISVIVGNFTNLLSRVTVNSAYTADVDYDSTAVVLEFETMDEPGLARLCANITIIDDLLGNEPNELFSVTFSDFTPEVGRAGDVAEACVTIIDNDGK